MVAAPETLHAHPHAASPANQGQQQPPSADSIKQQREAAALPGHQGSQAMNGDRQGASHSLSELSTPPSYFGGATRASAAAQLERSSAPCAPLASGPQRTFPARLAPERVRRRGAFGAHGLCGARREALAAAGAAGRGPAGEAHEAGRDEVRGGWAGSGAQGARPGAYLCSYEVRRGSGAAAGSLGPKSALEHLSDDEEESASTSARTLCRTRR